MSPPYELVLSDIVETDVDSVSTTERKWPINFYNVDDMKFEIITLTDLSADVISQTYKLYIKFNGDNSEEIYGEKFEETQEFNVAQTPPITPTVDQTALQNLYNAFKAFDPLV